MLDITKMNLGGPSTSSVIKGSKFISKLRFQGIKAKMY